MENAQKFGVKGFSAILLAVIVVTSLVAGGLAGYLLGSLPLSERIKDLESELLTLKQQASNLQTTQTIVNNTYILGGNISLSDLFI